MLLEVLPGGWGTAAKGVATGATAMGWGRTRGGSLMSNLKRAHDFTKKHRLISRGAHGLHKITGNKHLKVLGNVAGTYGYGIGYGGGEHLLIAEVLDEKKSVERCI